jgi:hypothetical protein
MSTNAQKLAQFLTPEDYDISNLSFGVANKNKEYGFTQRKLKYTREDVDDDKNIIKMSNFQVAKVYSPDPEHKNPKYTVIFAAKPTIITGKEDEDDYEPVENSTYEATRKFCEAYNEHVLQHVYENRDDYFDDEYNMEDIKANYKQPFKINEDSVSFTVSFPFNNPNAKNNVRIAYVDTNTPPEVIQSTNLEEKLAVGSVCEVFLHFTNYYQDDTDTFKLQSSVYFRIHMTQYQKLSSLLSGNGAGSGTFRFQEPISDIDYDDIEVGSVITNDKQGRSLKPKIKYTTTKGEQKNKINYSRY